MSISAAIYGGMFPLSEAVWVDPFRSCMKDCHEFQARSYSNLRNKLCLMTFGTFGGQNVAPIMNDGSLPVEFHLCIFQWKMANVGHVSVTDPSPSSLQFKSSLQHHQVPFFTPFGYWSFRGQCCYHTGNASGLTGRNAALKQRWRKISKTGRLLLGRSSLSAGWWSEDLGLGGMTIETEPSWNRWYFNIFHSSAQWSSYPEILSNNM